VTFSGERAGGWQQATFTSPVATTANTTYIVSYYAPNGPYAADANGFAHSQGVDNAQLHALANGVDGANGVYRCRGQDRDAAYRRRRCRDRAARPRRSASTRSALVFAAVSVNESRRVPLCFQL